MARFEIKSAVGGLSDWDNRGIQGAFKFGSALDIRKKTDSLSCQQALVSETCSGAGFTDLILWTIPASDGYTYGFGDTGKIYKRDPNTKTWSVIYTEAGGKITGAAEWFNQSGEAFLYWADDNDDLHRKQLPGLSNWSDVDAGAEWPKTNLDDADWHTMRMADGALMIGNGNKLAMVGYDDSYTTEAVRLFPDDVAKAIIDRDERVVAGTYKRNSLERGTLFTWNQEALNFIQRKPVPVKGINALVDSEAMLMQAGPNGGVFYSDFYDNMIPLPLITFPGGGQVNPDGVDVDEGLALFGVYGGTHEDIVSGVYTLGRKLKNGPFVPNLDYPLDCDEIGSVKNIGTDILISYKDGSTYGVKRVDTANKAQAIYSSLDLTAPRQFQDQVTWEAVVLPTKEMPEDTAIEVWYRVNKEGSFVQAKMEGEVTQFTEGKDAAFLIGAEGKIFEYRVILIPSGNETPEVYFPQHVYFS